MADYPNKPDDLASRKPPRRRRRTVPFTISIKAPRCPECSSTVLAIQRSERDRYGNKTQHRKCEQCGATVRVFWY